MSARSISEQNLGRISVLFILWDGAEIVGPVLGRAKPVLQFRRKFVALAQSAHIVSTVGPAGLDQDVLALDKTRILEGLRRASTPAPGSRIAVGKPHHRQVLLE